MRSESDRHPAGGTAEAPADEPDFRLMVETVPHLVWQSNPLGDWIWASQQWSAFTGQSQGCSRGYGWLDAVHPEDRERTREAWRTASRCGHLAIEHRLHRRPANGTADGCYLWFSTQAMPRRSGDGRPTTWFGASTDIHELHMIREAQDRLVYELQRRGRNNLAVIRGIVRRVADVGATGEDAAAYIDGRLAALARIQAEVSREPLAGVALEVLIRGEISAHALPEPAEMSGPPVRLPLETAEKLGLALYELVLDAALDGHANVSAAWSATATHLTLVWRERSRPVARPDHGEDPCGENVQQTNLRQESTRQDRLRAEMLERMLAYDLRAVTTVAEINGERRVVIVLPLSR